MATQIVNISENINNNLAETGEKYDLDIRMGNEDDYSEITSGHFLNFKEKRRLVKRRTGFLTEEDKIEVLNLKMKGFSQKSLARRFKCTNSQIAAIVHNADLYKNNWSDLMFEANIPYRPSNETYKLVNAKVLEWYNLRKIGCDAVSCREVQRKAKEISQEMKVTQFQASHGWMDGFRKRYNIIMKNGYLYSNETPKSPTPTASASPVQSTSRQSTAKETLSESHSKKSIKPLPQPVLEPETEVCLRWNSHHSNMQNTFPYLMEKEKYVDVTLVAEGNRIKCHQLILSSCSTYFDEMLKDVNPLQHPIIFLRDMPHWQVQALVDFMYKGEVNVDQKRLESLLEAAEVLQIKGLAGKIPKKEVGVESSEVAPDVRLEQVLDEFKLDSGARNYASEDEDFRPYYYYKKKLKKSKKRAVPAPGQLKTVPCNLKGTKTRPNIKQPKFYDPDFPDHDPSRSVTPPSIETDQMYHLSNIKIEPIDIDASQSPTHYYSSQSNITMTEVNQSDHVFNDNIAFGDTISMFSQSKSSKDMANDEPPLKKPAMTIRPIHRRELSDEPPVIIKKIISSNIAKPPFVIDKIVSNYDEKLNEAPVTIEKIVSFNSDTVVIEPVTEDPTISELAKKFCIRVVKVGKNSNKSTNNLSSAKYPSNEVTLNEISQNCNKLESNATNNQPSTSKLNAPIDKFLIKLGKKPSIEISEHKSTSKELKELDVCNITKKKTTSCTIRQCKSSFKQTTDANNEKISGMVVNIKKEIDDESDNDNID